jgi:hypothetical protein
MIHVLRTLAAPVIAGLLGICDGIRVRWFLVRPYCVQRHRVRGFMED